MTTTKSHINTKHQHTTLHQSHRDFLCMKTVEHRTEYEAAALDIVILYKL